MQRALISLRSFPVPRRETIRRMFHSSFVCKRHPPFCSLRCCDFFLIRWKTFLTRSGKTKTWNCESETWIHPQGGVSDSLLLPNQPFGTCPGKAWGPSLDVDDTLAVVTIQLLLVLGQQWFSSWEVLVLVRGAQIWKSNYQSLAAVFGWPCWVSSSS